MAKAVGYRIIVKLILTDDAKKIADSVIHIPEEYKNMEAKASGQAEVIEIGASAYTGSTSNWFKEGSELKVGDKVHILKYKGQQIKQTDGSYIMIINDNDVLALVSDTDVNQ